MIEQQLIKDIIRNPYDLSLRLIFADWLEDQDRIYEADLVRSGLEYEGTIPVSKGVSIYAYIKGGFAYKVNLDITRLHKYGSILFNAHPIVDIEIEIRSYRLIYSRRYWHYNIDYLGNICPFMTGKVSETNISYASKREAITDFKQACIKYGRSLIV